VSPGEVILAVALGALAAVASSIGVLPPSAINAGASITVAALFLRYLRRRDDVLGAALQEVNKTLGAAVVALREGSKR